MRVAVTTLILTVLATSSYAADASFRCTTASAYRMLSADKPTEEEWVSRILANNKVDVLVHDGKALVTTTLFGGIDTREFNILQVGGAQNGWRLLWVLPGQASTPTIIIDIMTWDLETALSPIRMSVYYSGDIGIGTCTRVFGEIGVKKK